MHLLNLTCVALPMLNEAATMKIHISLGSNLRGSAPRRRHIQLTSNHNFLIWRMLTYECESERAHSLCNDKMTISYLIIKKLRLRQSQTGSRIIQTDRQTSAVAQGLQMGDRAFGVDNRCPIEDRFGQLTYPQCMVTNTYSH